MKVTFVNYYYDKDIPIDKYVEKYQTIIGWGKALANQGLEVKVYHRFNKDCSFRHHEVDYYLIKDDLENDLKWFQNPKIFHEKIKTVPQEIIHINSFRYAYQASLLKRKVPSAKIVIQHHAEKPDHWLKNFLLKKFTSSVDGFLFSSKEIYNKWVESGAISHKKKFAEIMEGSSEFLPAIRIESRKKTGMSGKPIFLWVGRLNENKDPITVLTGFSKLLSDFPEAKMYMIYSEDDLISEIETSIRQNTVLQDSVRLIGFVKYSEMQEYYNSSDYFVLGSHYEGSGFSLVEAMSCGVIPIVTDIPSFRMITNHGNVGALWKCGNVNSFYEKAKLIISQPIEQESAKALKFFNDDLSYPAIGRKAKLFYESLL